MVAKTIAYILFVLLVCTVMVGTAATLAMLSGNIYNNSQAATTENVFSDFAREDGQSVLIRLSHDDLARALSYCENTNFGFRAYGPDGTFLGASYGAENATPSGLQYQFAYTQNSLKPADKIGGGKYVLDAYVDDTFAVQDKYYKAQQWIGYAYDFRYIIPALTVLCGALAVCCFVFLICSAGRRAGKEELVTGPLFKVPLDFLTVTIFALVMIPAFFVADIFYNSYSEYIALGAALLLAALFLPCYCMNLAIRLKLGGWWKNTLIYKVGSVLLRMGLRILKGTAATALWLGRGARKLGNSFAEGLPFVWKLGVALLLFSVIELILFLLLNDPLYSAGWLIVWGIGQLLLSTAILYTAILLQRLRQGGEMLAAGDLAYQVDTKGLFWELKSHGEALNRIGEGMSLAVEERMKSERFKTELITNVSHDIKTPLTSIINYADLIGKETDSGNVANQETISEYAQVLLRQSERLKKLIDDLVEASKATTGNVEVFLAPCEVGVLLTQTVGEYEKRLQDVGLELIARQPELPVKILADGRHLWRVFDNLMNNACKYSQQGTRVYLTVSQENKQAVISFKNTSSFPLSLSEDALLERFVRGDGSRSTEGSGLGLSIAQSLTELQGGSFHLTVDGDLFKVILRFDSL